MSLLNADPKPAVVDKVICLAPVLPAYGNGKPEYVGVLQWCTGLNVPVMPDEPPSRMFELVARNKGQVRQSHRFYFKAIKHTLSLFDCTKRNGDAAVLAAFEKLCNDNRITMAFDSPFLPLLEDPMFKQRIIDQITEQFNLLHEGEA